MARHGNKQRVPVDLEKNLLASLEEAANKNGIKRTVLMRIFIKYGLNNLEPALKFGDKIFWQPEGDISNEHQLADRSNNP